MNNTLLNELAKSATRKPYALSTERPVNPGNIVITLDGDKLADVPSSIAAFIVNLLNGAYAEGSISAAQLVDSYYKINV